MGIRGSIEFVENRDVQGCFAADVEALAGIDQDDVNGALADSELYDRFNGLQLVPASILNDSMQAASLPVRFSEELPFFNGFQGDEIALDDSSEAAVGRLEILQRAFTRDDYQGTILHYPCQRTPDQAPFGHFVALTRPQERGAEFTIMDPSELPGHGGVFQKNRREALELLVPKPELMIPVLAYAVQIVPVPGPFEGAKDGAAEAEVIDLHRRDLSLTGPVLAMAA